MNKSNLNADRLKLQDNIESALCGEKSAKGVSKMSLQITKKEKQSVTEKVDTDCFSLGKKAHRMAFRLSDRDYSLLKEFCSDREISISKLLRDSLIEKINQQKNSLVA